MRRTETSDMPSTVWIIKEAIKFYLIVGLCVAVGFIAVGCGA